MHRAMPHVLLVEDDPFVFGPHAAPSADISGCTSGHARRDGGRGLGAAGAPAGWVILGIEPARRLGACIPGSDPQSRFTNPRRRVYGDAGRQPHLRIHCPKARPDHPQAVRPRIAALLATCPVDRKTLPAPWAHPMTRTGQIHHAVPAPWLGSLWPRAACLVKRKNKNI
jgi:hypothetical protein